MHTITQQLQLLIKRARFKSDHIIISFITTFSDRQYCSSHSEMKRAVGRHNGQLPLHPEIVSGPLAGMQEH